MHVNERDGHVLRPVSPYGLHPEEETIAEFFSRLDTFPASLENGILVTKMNSCLPGKVSKRFSAFPTVMI